ncbi:MAG: alpha/beta fold hydrolase [Micrococcales bacterium]|nr:alpha/beta fold hydrolase [Micrococcales bacterium]
MLRARALLVGAVLTAGALAVSAWSPVPAAPVPAASPAAESAGRGRLLQFTLPYLRARPADPNAVSLARHAGPGAPLLLFLPATGAVPADYTAFLRTASDAGYSVLGLDYFNRGKSLTRTCGPDADCYDKFQRNRFDGSSPSRFSRVDAADSILTRLRAALDYLAQHDRRGGWERYRDGAGIRWSRVVVAGHSQGGGEAAFISHYRRVRGVLMFAAPVETFDDVSAGWMERPGRTPAARMYGLASVGDMYYDRIAPTWTTLGMGRVDSADATRVPRGSRTLLSTLALGTPRQAHGRIVGDRTPRVRDSSPRLEPTWEWMLRQVR